MSDTVAVSICLIPVNIFLLVLLCFLASILVWPLRQLQAEKVVSELQNQLLELKERPRSIPLRLLFCLFNKSQLSLLAVFDHYKALPGLESLVGLARDNAHARTKRFSTILRQCRPLLGKSQFQSILLKLVGDKEDVERCESYPEVPVPFRFMGAQHGFGSAWSRFLPQVSWFSLCSASTAYMLQLSQAWSYRKILPKEISCFFVCFCRSDLWINVLCLDMFYFTPGFSLN